MLGAKLEAKLGAKLGAKLARIVRPRIMAASLSRPVKAPRRFPGGSRSSRAEDRLKIGAAQGRPKLNSA